MKPTPKHTPFDMGFKHRDLRRGFNHNLERMVKWYDDQYIVNVEAIWLDDKEFFDPQTRTSLSRKGYKEFWKAVDQAVKDIDKTQ